MYPLIHTSGRSNGLTIASDFPNVTEGVMAGLGADLTTSWHCYYIREHGFGIYISEQSFPFPKRLYGFKGSFGFSTKLYSVLDVSHSKEVLLRAGTETSLKTQ